MFGFVLSELPAAVSTYLVMVIWDRHRHIRSLRAQLGPHVPDIWTLRCEACHRVVRKGRAIVLSTSTPERTSFRVWHADRPKCSAAGATDAHVLSVYAREGSA